MARHRAKTSIPELTTIVKKKDGSHVFADAFQIRVNVDMLSLLRQPRIVSGVFRPPNLLTSIPPSPAHFALFSIRAKADQQDSMLLDYTPSITRVVYSTIKSFEKANSTTFLALAAIHFLLDEPKLLTIFANGEVGVTYIKDSWVRLDKHPYPRLVCFRPGYFPSFSTIICGGGNDGFPGFSSIS